MGIKRGHKYGESTKTECPLCGLLFQRSGVFGHLKYKHDLTDDEARQAIAGELPTVSSDEVANEPVQVPANASSDLKSLGEDVSRLRLLKQKRDLTGLGESVPPPAKSAVVKNMEDELEITQLEGRIRSAQSRLSNPAQPQSKEPTWWDSLMKNTSLTDIVGLVRGNSQGGGGQDTLSTFIGFLKLMGINSLKELSSQGRNEAFLPEDIKIPGTDTILPKGTPVSAIPMFVDVGGRNRMADAFEKVLMPAVQSYVDSRPSGGPGGQGIAKEPRQEIMEYACPECGVVERFDITHAQVGDKTDFKCKGCGYEGSVEITAPEKPVPKPRVKRQKPAPAPEPEVIECLKCHGQIDILGYGTGDKVVCGHCGTEVQIAEPLSVALPAQPVKKEGPETLEERNRRQ